MVVIFVGLLCWGLRYFSYYSYCRILRGGSFLFPPEPLSVKLLNRKSNLYLGQFWSHELVRAFNFVLLILVDLITLNIFG
jgi:hypothetical protein